MVQYSPGDSMMLTSHMKEINAVSVYDMEGYDDAFLKAVEKVEEKHCSPMNSPIFLTSCQSLRRSTNGRTINRRSEMDVDICRDDLTPKKLDFSAAIESFKKPSSTLDMERHMKLERWHNQMKSNSDLKFPSIEALEALGELCQEKALLVLSHFPNGGWEKAVSLITVKRCKSMELSEIDDWMCQISCGSKSLKSKTDWSKQQDNHIVFHGEISTEGIWSIKGPYFEQTNSPLQRVFGNGGVLRVHFTDYMKNSEVVEGIYRKVSREGIWVGLRCYRFFAYKDPKGRKKQSGFVVDVSTGPKCFFVCTESLAKWDWFNPNFHQYGNVREAQQYLMHINTVPNIAKKISRLQLALSQTHPILDLNSSDIKVEIIEDIYCRNEYGEVVCDANGDKLIHTDGTGFISKDLAACCPASVCKGNTKAKRSVKTQELPLLLQVRLFHRGMVAKGTLLVHYKLPPLTIQLRKSMVKVKSDKNITCSSYNSLEVCSTSRPPGKARLSPYLALLLTYGGVPEEVIMKFVEEELHEITTKTKVRTAALTALTNSDQGDHYDSAVRMLVANLPLEEPYLQKVLLDLTRSQLQELSTGRVTICDTYNLMGCADPTGRLERNQVAIILEHGPIRCPKVLVYKSPGLHVGDVKEFEATWHRDFEDIVGNGKYVIFFSVKGPRSVVDEIANSDLDGDQYWCCFNGMIVKYFKPSDVWKNPGSKKTLSKTSNGVDDFDKHHFEVYLKARFKPSQAMGIAATSWQAHMDKFLMLDEHHPGKEKLWCRIQSLVNTYYEAVDAEKTGKQISVRDEDRATEWPHYKEKNEQVGSKWIRKESTYRSTTILGKIYDVVKGECDTKDFLRGLEALISQDTFIDKQYRYSGFETYHEKWEAEYKEYRSRMWKLLYEKDAENRRMEIEALFQKYKWELYKSDTLIDSLEPMEEIYKQASAIYAVVYSHAQRKLESLTKEDLVRPHLTLGLQFAWKVAGSALLKLYGRNWHGKRKEPILIEEAVFCELKFSRKDKD